MNNNSINLYQKRMAFFIGMHIPVFAAICIFLKTDIIAPMILQGALTLMAFMAVNLNKKSKHVSYDLSSICIALTPAVFVYAFEGHTWQIDAHMYFFAAMAMLIAFKSIRAMLIGTLTVALHHIILNFALPYALYPEGTDFSRVILHAVILLVETGVLILIIRDINNSDRHLESESDKAKEALGEAEKQKELTDKAKVEAEGIRIQSMIKLADDFDQAIGELISSLSSSSTTLESTAVTMKDIVSQSEDSSTLVANLLSSAVQNLNTVTTAMEEITAASQEISQQVSSIKHKSINTNKEAESANDEVNNLNTLADNIGEVVVAIRDIAEQTNLLALNATIEAARAGESGKGFAVVADEVKKLASETANKTDDINNRVLEIQSASQQTVQAMGRIISETANMEDSIVAVSAAVEEQTSTTAEIARGISQVSDSIDGVNETMKGVKESVDSTGSASQNVSSTSVEVSNLAKDLESSVNGMLNKIRSDS